MKEESEIPHLQPQLKPKTCTKRRVGHVLMFVTAAFVLAYYMAVPFHPHHHRQGGGREAHPGHRSLCNNPPKLQPDTYQSDNSSLDYLKSYEFRNSSLERFQKVIRVPTESNELMGPPDKDERWQVFTQLHDVLEDSYPLVHSHLTKEVVNKFGLLYTWKGSDESLKPVILMAHQDVVPVLPETRDQWLYEPYGAHFDGESVWGRGSVDDKDSVVSILEAVETLLDDGQQPRRTVLISFGYDEESSGVYGASQLAKTIEQRYGQDSIHALIDEGGLGVMRLKGTDVAIVSVAEKGNFGAEITMHTKGGHSSIPPDHTGIGYIAELVALVEATPHTPTLSHKNPLLQGIHCLAEHSQTLDKQTKRFLSAVGKCPRATQKMVDMMGSNPMLKYLLQTSQAVDIINGGLKINALPETVTVRIDNRVSVDSTTEEVESKLFNNVKEIANRHNLGVRYKGEVVVEGEQYFDFAPFNKDPLEPAPLTPTSGEAWDEFVGTVRHIYEDFAGPLLDVETLEFNQPQEMVVAPAMMTGNTDTRFYWNLTPNIYRFNAQRLLTDPSHPMGGIHTVNEHINYDVHIEAIAFYRQYLQNL